MACSRCWARVSFSSSPWSCACWALRSVIWPASAGLAGQRLAGEVLAAHRDRLLGLALELGGLLLELVDLELDALAAGGDVGDAAAYLREQVELALVAVVERLARILGAVEGLVGLRPEDQADALHETHGVRSLSQVIRCSYCHVVQYARRASAQGRSRGTPVGLARPGSPVVPEGARVVPSHQVRDPPPRQRDHQGRTARAVPRRRAARPRPPPRPAPRCRAPARRWPAPSARARTESSQRSGPR